MIREAIELAVSGRHLSAEQASAVMEEMMSGQATPAQLAAFVTALRMKGETIDEIVGMARVMREKALRVHVPGPLLDTCGTGGDASGTFNISTCAAFVAAGAGVRVAKHGNRSMTSQCGSADVLEALGVKIELRPEGVARCIQEAGIGFMFAPAFHPAMKHAAGPRREIGIRTVFNILGPLTNPAGAEMQLLGVADGELAKKLAQVLLTLGSRHALVVHSEGGPSTGSGQGLDELTTATRGWVWEVSGGKVKSYAVSPADAGLPQGKLEDLRGGSPKDNATIVRAVLSGEKGARRDTVLLNAGAALVAAERAQSLKEGVKLAVEAIDSGRATKALEDLVRVSQAAS